VPQRSRSRLPGRAHCATRGGIDYCTYEHSCQPIPHWSPVPQLDAQVATGATGALGGPDRLPARLRDRGLGGCSGVTTPERQFPRWPTCSASREEITAFAAAPGPTGLDARRADPGEALEKTLRQ
jgi:hypothetical protein